MDKRVWKYEVGSSATKFGCGWINSYKAAGEAAELVREGFCYI